MAAKREREDDEPVVQSPDTLRALLSSSITDRTTAIIVFRYIMEEYNIDLNKLEQLLAGRSPPIKYLISGNWQGSNSPKADRIDIDLSFSDVKYVDIAPLVGLSPYRHTNDIEAFDLRRSRIPTALFKSIVEDIDLMLVQYGPPIEHCTEEAML